MKFTENKNFWKGVVITCNIMMGVTVVGFIVTFGITMMTFLKNFGAPIGGLSSEIFGGFKHIFIMMVVTTVVFIIGSLLKSYASKRFKRANEEDYYEAHKHDDDFKGL